MPSRTTALALLLAVASMALALACFTPRWQTNDDPVREMIVAGSGIALSPDVHLVASSIVLGALLKQLYEWGPDVPWYALQHVGTLFFAFAALAYLLLQSGWALGVASYVVLFGTAGLDFLLNLQFSTTAFLACGAGLALGLGAPTAGWRSALAGSLLFTLGSLGRREFALPAAACVVLPSAVLALAAGGLRGLLLLARRAILVVAPAVLLLCVDVVHDARCDEWRSFWRVAPSLRELVDLDTIRYSKGTAGVFEEIGWTRNDWELVRAWFYSDPHLYDLEKLERLRRAVPYRRWQWTLKPSTWRELARLAQGPFAPLLLVIPWVFFLASRTGRWQAVALAATTLVGAAGVYIASVIGHRPPALLAALFSFPLLAACALGPLKVERARLLGGVFLAVGLWGVFVSVREARIASAQARYRNALLRSSVGELGASPQRLYVAWATAFPYEWTLPLEDPRYLRGLRLFSLGWPQSTPVGRRMLRAYGIDDVFRALYDRDDVSLIAVPDALPLLNTFGREHRGLRVSFKVERQLAAFTVYRGFLRGAVRDAPTSP